MFKSLGVGVLVLALAACGAPRARQGTPPSPDASAGRPELPVGGTVYHVDEAQSELRILVFRAGPLAHGEVALRSFGNRLRNLIPECRDVQRPAAGWSRRAAGTAS